jgi:hypothetical protein
MGGLGLEGFDPLVAIKDCSCKSPLLDALKRQTDVYVKEKGDITFRRNLRRDMT